jgi:hypothetical protein
LPPHAHIGEKSLEADTALENMLGLGETFKKNKPGSIVVSDTFASFYAPLLKAVFSEQAREQIAQGTDAFAAARAYAELGKPDFTLAFLLVVEHPEGEKREILAHAYERRSALALEKAKELSLQFHRPFPLIKLEARKDLLAAEAVRKGQPLPESANKFLS